MWIPTYHAFPSGAAFLAACDVAGWLRGPDGKPMPAEGAVLQEIGPIIAPPSIGPMARRYPATCSTRASTSTWLGTRGSWTRHSRRARACRQRLLAPGTCRTRHVPAHHPCPPGRARRHCGKLAFWMP